ncbi:MAG TPA: energy transducer TonB [Gemmatimonadales bacterium]|nr:energy transducer TonB [Gemmatimonadales bacterium]
MSLSRSEPAWTSSGLSALVHAAVIAAALHATRPSAIPPSRVVSPMHWEVAVALAVPHRGHAGSGAGTGVPHAAPALPTVDGALPDPLPLVDLQTGAPEGRPLPVTARSKEVGLPSLVVPDEGEGPAALYLPPPAYPRSAPARRAGTIDSVVVEYLITTEGRVDPEQLSVVIATDQSFASAVRRTLSEARFRPARRNSSAVPALARQVFRFIRR